MKVKWSWNPAADGYQLEYSKDPYFLTSKRKSYSFLKDSVGIKGLSKNKRYYVRVRSYVNDSYGDRVYGDWSSKKSVKV